MEGLNDLFTFVGDIGDELFNIFAGEGQVTVAPEGFKIRPVVIAGPSGVGKGTLIDRLMKEHPNCFGFSVSHTTRDPRAGEVNGVHYHFMKDKQAMLAMIEANEFLESANVHGNLYGTSKTAVADVASGGQICVLDIDVQGVKSVKGANLNPNPMFIFIKPPSTEELEKRLRGRGSETEEKIQARLKNATDEIAYADEEEGSNFDAVLVNDNLDTCYAELKALLASNLLAVVMYHKEVAANAAAKAKAEAEAEVDAEAEAEAEAPAAAEEAPATPPIAAPVTPVRAEVASPVPGKTPATPDQMKAKILAMIRQKEADYDVANNAKDRVLAKSLLDEIEMLESTLTA